MKNHLISRDATIVEALDSLNRLSGSTMVLFVTGPDGSLLGSLTDGDIRRALLSGSVLSDRVGPICKRGCMFLTAGRHDVGMVAEARAKGIALLPVVADGRIVSLVDLNRQRGLIPADAVLMAGGIGERLRPMTATVPKPLLPVGGRPIIDHNVELLRSFGIENIFVTVNYLKQRIISHFEEDAAGVTCVEEPSKLGTIGSLSLISGLRSPNVIVMNADLLTDINLEAMYLKHIETEAWLTMAVVPYSVSVPYAIVSHSGDRVEGLVEKPTYNYYANAGVYMLARKTVDLIPKGKYMDATDLIDRLVGSGRRVSISPVEGRWLDIGSPDDYRHACELMAGS